MEPNLIPSIRTEYNGHTFRSRLEARWAVLFEQLSIPYVFEPATVHIADERSYLPDFWMPSVGIWIEIKSEVGLDAVSIAKADGLAQLMQQPVFVFSGMFHMKTFLCQRCPELHPIVIPSGVGVSYADPKAHLGSWAGANRLPFQIDEVIWCLFRAGTDNRHLTTHEALAEIDQAFHYAEHYTFPSSTGASRLI